VRGCTPQAYRGDRSSRDLWDHYTHWNRNPLRWRLHGLQRPCCLRVGDHHHSTGSLATGTDTLDRDLHARLEQRFYLCLCHGYKHRDRHGRSSFTIASPTAPQTVQPGGAATYTINVNPVNGAYSSVVNLTASGLPTGATASFVPATDCLRRALRTATSTLTVQTPAHHNRGKLTLAAGHASPALLGLFFVTR